MRSVVIAVLLFVATALAIGADSVTGAGGVSSYPSLVYLTGGTCGTSVGSVTCASNTLTDSAAGFKNFEISGSISVSCTNFGVGCIQFYRSDTSTAIGPSKCISTGSSDLTSLFGGPFYVYYPASSSFRVGLTSTSVCTLTATSVNFGMFEQTKRDMPNNATVWLA